MFLFFKKLFSILFGAILFTKSKNAKEICYGINFGNGYACLFWLFLAAECYKSIQSKNSKRHESTVYYAYHHRLHSRYFCKAYFVSDQLRVDCLHFEFGNCLFERNCIFPQRFAWQEVFARYGGIKMREAEIKNYAKLNDLASLSNTVSGNSKWCKWLFCHPNNFCIT